MTSTISLRPTLGRRFRSCVLLLLATAVGVVALDAGTAKAADLQSSYGQPGWISAHSSAVASAPTNDIFSQALPSGAIGLDSLYLYASPASSQTQVAVVTSTLYSCWFAITASSCWRMGTSATSSWYVTPGGWRWIQDRSPLNLAFNTGNAYSYFVQLTVRWQTTSGVFLGQKSVNYRATGDLTCATTRCQTSDGYGYFFPG
ncbi:MAG: hypothetical protein V7644_1075 [Actinomycetota bacterium]|jgi:hypothetical protein